MIEALGVTLLEFVLHGTLVALGLAALLALSSGASARFRYAASCLGLVALLALPVVRFTTALRDVRARTAAGLATAAPAPDPLPRTAGALSAATTAPASSSVPFALEGLRSAARRASGLLPSVVALWAAGVVLLSARFLAGFTLTLRLRNGLERLGEVEERLLASLKERLGVHRALTAGSSTHVDVPTVVGWLKPVLLVPASAVSGLTAAQLEALLAHELAHVRRHDALVNFLQTAVETLLFYHPAVWWVSRRIRVERENCCDDVAVGAIGDSVGYARALVALEELRRGPSLVLAANGGSLAGRVRRLLVAPARRSASAAAACAAALLLAALAARGALDTTPSGFSVSKAAPAKTARPRPNVAVAPDDLTVHARPAPMIATAFSPIAASAVEDAEPGDATPAIAGEGAAEAAEDPPAEESRKKSPPGLPTVDELIALRQHGVTPEYLDDMAALGYTSASVRDLIRLRDAGVTPEYVKAMKAAGYGGIPAAKLIELRNHGVSPEWVKELTDLGYGGLSVQDLIRLRSAGITPELVKRLRRSS
jgi:beta-lactamase regulating signal transducer with metallopeptidase domain